MGEIEYAAILCLMMLGGETEQRHEFAPGIADSFIKIDCETPTEVIEVGLDSGNSLDSVQQALFAHSLTGKKPVVVLIDKDGREGAYEYRIKTVAKMTGVEYRSVSDEFLIRWRMTNWLRNYGTTMIATN